MKYYDKDADEIVDLFGEDAIEHCLNCPECTQYENASHYCTFDMDYYICIDEISDDFECPRVTAMGKKRGCKGTDRNDVTMSYYEFGDIIIYAERYALGRMTFATQDICNLISKHITELTPRDMRVIIRDIEMAKERNNLGHSGIDAPVWLSTLGNLKYELETRP